MSDRIKFNINDYVYVKITEDGQKHIRRYYEDLFKEVKKYMPEHFDKYVNDSCSLYEPDEDGYVRMQIWGFIEMFSPVIKIGSPITCFDANLYFQSSL